MGLFSKIFGGGGKVKTFTSGGYRSEIEPGMLELVKALQDASGTGVNTLEASAAGDYLFGGPIDAVRESIGRNVNEQFMRNILPQLSKASAQAGGYVSSGSDRLFSDAQDNLAKQLADAFASLDFSNYQQERQNQLSSASQLLGQTQAAANPFRTSFGQQSIEKSPSIIDAINKIGGTASSLAGGYSDFSAALANPEQFASDRAGASALASIFGG